MSTVSLRVATWNVEHASPRQKKHGAAVRDVLRTVAADVWVLTESDPEFAPDDDYRLVAQSAEPRDPRTGRAWVAIWVRKELSTSPTAELTADPSRTAAACIHLNEHAPVIVYGTVLPWRRDTLWPRRFSERFSGALEAQAKEWNALRDTYRAELCVAGDFNQELTGRIRVGSGAGRETLRDVLERCQLSCPTSAPHDPVGEILGRGSIDHILISAGLQATTVNGRPQVTIIPAMAPLPRTLSDHYGVSVELTPNITAITRPL